jgi:hypothetical protein
MGIFLTPVDVANSALDEVGADPIVALTDNTKRAAVVARNLDKLRQAELRRNVWRFSIRKAPLRAVDVTTMFPVWANYNAAKIYIAGSIVTAVDTRPYIARGPVPLATPPGSPNEAYWDLYFGPVTASPWIPGAATSGPNLWNSIVVYNVGDQVVGVDDKIYTSQTADNVGNNPVTDEGIHWAATGVLGNTGGYFAGELVYVLNGLTPSVYISLTNDNADNPSTISVWDATTTYSIDQTVMSNSVTYQSSIDLNFNQTPVAAWVSGTTYAMGAEILASDNNLYTSVAGSNTGHNPVGDAGVHWTLVGPAPWVATPGTQADVMQGLNWLLLDAGIRSLQIVYPLGCGPSSQASTRNIYRLPAGYLRKAPQDPKAGSQSWLGAPSNLNYDDWEFEGQWIVSRDVRVIVLRFAADVADVSQMDPLFQEGWALRVAEKVCEPLTQSTTKISIILQKYKVFMGEARAVNGIEEGSDEPPLDDYLACRW